MTSERVAQSSISQNHWTTKSKKTNGDHASKNLWNFLLIWNPFFFSPALPLVASIGQTINGKSLISWFNSCADGEGRFPKLWKKAER
jgi:hypothetical protein